MFHESTGGDRVQASVLITAVVSALLGAAGGFVSNFVLKRAETRRGQRVALFLDLVPACREEMRRYDEAVGKHGPLATMDVDGVRLRLMETFRAAMTASRADASRAWALGMAARDLDQAQQRFAAGDQPRRQRDNGWAGLVVDTIAQAERALLEYQDWLGTRLLGRRPPARRGDYHPIEIDRDLSGEDPARFACPPAITTEYLAALLERPILSWAVIDNYPIHGTILLIWVDSISEVILRRLNETDNAWLFPLLHLEDPAFRGLWRVAAALQTCPALPAERRIPSTTVVIAEQPLPALITEELARAQNSQ